MQNSLLSMEMLVQSWICRVAWVCWGHCFKSSTTAYCGAPFGMRLELKPMQHGAVVKEFWVASGCRMLYIAGWSWSRGQKQSVASVVPLARPPKALGNEYWDSLSLTELDWNRCSHSGKTFWSYNTTCCHPKSQCSKSIRMLNATWLNSEVSCVKPK